MLVFRCSVHKSFRIGDITVTVLQVRGDRVRFRVDGPDDVPVYREEVLEYLRDAADQALAELDAAAI